MNEHDAGEGTAAAPGTAGGERTAAALGTAAVPGTGAAPGTTRRPTGDDAVDDVLAQLDAVADQPLDAQIEVGEQVHRVLRSRLADLGKE